MKIDKSLDLLQNNRLSLKCPKLGQGVRKKLFLEGVSLHLGRLSAELRISGFVIVRMNCVYV